MLSHSRNPILFKSQSIYYLLLIYYYIYWFYSSVLYLLLSFTRDQSRDVTPRLGDCGWFFIFDYSSPFFLVIEIRYTLSISYIVLTCYVYYYCIWFGFNTLFSCFFARVLLFSRNVSVMHGMWLLASEFLLIKSVLHFAFMNPHSGCYYYDFVVIGVLRPSRGLQKFTVESLKYRPRWWTKL